MDMLYDCDQELAKIEARINEDKFDSLNSCLISYAVMKACGVLEVVYKNMIADTVSIGATSEAKNYLDRQIRDNASNPNVGNMLRLLESLSNQWRIRFDDQTKGTIEKGSLGSLVGLRNDFAHGRTVTASIKNVRQYFRDGQTILKWLEDILNST